MKRLTPLALALALALLSGCAALTGQKPVIENRFAPTNTISMPIPQVKIRVSSSEVANAGGGISLTALSDRGQAAMVEQTKGKPPTTIKGGGGSRSVVTTRDTISRHLVIAIQSGSFLPPGDRVDAIRISLSVHPSQADRWAISAWTQASNGEKVIELGKLTDTASSKVSAETGLNIAKFLVDAKVSGESSQSSVREVQLKDVTEFDAAVDQDGVAWLTETAGWRQNLGHNLAVDVVLGTEKLELDPSGTVVFSDLETKAADGSSKPAEAKDVSLLPGVVYAPIKFEREPVCGIATLDYRIRHVIEGASTFSESDDKIEFKNGSDKAAFLISPAPWIPYYVLRSAGRPMSYKRGMAPPASLVFESLDDATAFRDWLRLKAPAGGALGNAAIGFTVAGKYRAPTDKEYGNLVPGLQNEGRALPTAPKCTMDGPPPAAATAPPAETTNSLKG